MPLRSRLLGAAKKRAPVVSAMRRRVALSGGTGTRRSWPVSSGTSTMPSSVPSAMVNTGTPSALASAAASSGCVWPWVLAPSDSSSTTSGGSLPVSFGTVVDGGGALPPRATVGGGPLGVQRADRVQHRGPVGGGPGEGLGGGGERHDPHAELGGELVDEGGRGLLGGDQAGRLHVGAVHRPGDVHDQHH